MRRRFGFCESTWHTPSCVSSPSHLKHAATASVAQLLRAHEDAAARAGVHTVALGADEAPGFDVRCGWTPLLLLQWVYDPNSFEAEAQAVLAGPALGRPHERRSNNGVPQLFVQLESADREVVEQSRALAPGAHVGFAMTKSLAPQP